MLHPSSAFDMGFEPAGRTARILRQAQPDLRNFVPFEPKRAVANGRGDAGRCSGESGTLLRSSRAVFALHHRGFPSVQPRPPHPTFCDRRTSSKPRPAEVGPDRQSIFRGASIPHLDGARCLHWASRPTYASTPAMGCPMITLCGRPLASWIWVPGGTPSRWYSVATKSAGSWGLAVGCAAELSDAP